MFFTLVIPAYNCQETIDRLLTSVVQQHYDDLKVIVIDDSKKEELCQDKINNYKDKLHIDYYIRNEKPYNYHCPGNTRHDGLAHALQENTEYIFFADCDDEFIPDSLQDIHDFLKNNNYPDAIKTSFYTLEGQTGKQLYIQSEGIGWLHGKFYKKEFLLKNDIQFQIDLISHEDIYFNNLVKSYLTHFRKDFVQCDKIFYKWYWRDTSESHDLTHKTGINFLEVHYLDWIKAATIPLYQLSNKFPQDIVYYRDQAVASLLLGYLYFQGFIYNNKTDNRLIKQNYRIFKNTLITIMNFFRISKREVIALGYNLTEVYTVSRMESQKSTGPFVEEQSFKDFIQSINIYED